MRLNFAPAASFFSEDALSGCQTSASLRNALLISAADASAATPRISYGDSSAWAIPEMSPLQTVARFGLDRGEFKIHDRSQIENAS